MIKLLSIVLFISCSLQAQYTKHILTAGTGYSAGNGILVSFIKHVPPANVNGKKHALMIFLHGQDDRGTPGDTTTVNGVIKVLNKKPAFLIKTAPLPAFTIPGTSETRKYAMLVPQCSSAFGTWPEMYVAEMIKYAKANMYNEVDTNRIILTGLSQGGGGSLGTLKFKYLCDQIAFMVPICPGYFAFTNYDSAARWAPPMIIYHAANDPTASVTLSDGMINSLNAKSPLCPVQYRRFTGVTPGSSGHNVWDIVYVTTAPGTAYQMTNGDNWIHNQTIFETGLMYTTNHKGVNGPRRPNGY
jgi:predicted peptidase